MELLSRLLLCSFLVYTFGADLQQPPHFLETETQSHFELRSDSTRQFKCKAGGVPTPTVKWVQTKSNAPDQQTRIKTLQPNGFLPPNEFTAQMQGVYQCIASNFYGVAVTNPITLNLAQDAVFDIYAGTKSVIAKEGDPLMINCKMERPSLPKASYSWLVHKDPKKGKPNIKFPSDWRRSIDNNSGSLYIAVVYTSDAMIINSLSWTYLCYAENPIFRSSKNGSQTKIHVQATPLTYRGPTRPSTLPEYQEIHILENQDQELFCFFNGEPIITYAWSKNGASVPALIKDGGTHLLITAAKDTSLYNGDYYCRGTNNDGQEFMNFMVIVDVKPYFDTNADAVKDTNATHGSTIEFKCIALGKPLPTIEWRKNNVNVKDLEPDSRVTYTIDGNVGTYKIERVQKGDYTTKSDSSVISCYANSSIGERYTSGYISVFIALSGPTFTLTRNGKVVTVVFGPTIKEYTGFQVRFCGPGLTSTTTGCSVSSFFVISDPSKTNYMIHVRNETTIYVFYLDLYDGDVVVYSVGPVQSQQAEQTMTMPAGSGGMIAGVVSAVVILVAVVVVVVVVLHRRNLACFSGRNIPEGSNHDDERTGPTRPGDVLDEPFYMKAIRAFKGEQSSDDDPQQEKRVQGKRSDLPRYKTDRQSQWRKSSSET